MMKLLLENSADINAKTEEGETVLMWAIGWKDGDMIKLLVENGADIQTEDIEGDIYH